MATVYWQHRRTVCVCVGSSQVEISHLTRRVAAILPGADLVVLGDFDPLVGLHASLAQPLATLHAEAYRSRVVLATRAHLWGGGGGSKSHVLMLCLYCVGIRRTR